MPTVPFSSTANQVPPPAGSLGKIIFFPFRISVCGIVAAFLFRFSSLLDVKYIYPLLVIKLTVHIVSDIEWWKELCQTDQACLLFLILIKQLLSAPGGVYNAPGYNTL